MCHIALVTRKSLPDLLISKRLSLFLLHVSKRFVREDFDSTLRVMAVLDGDSPRPVLLCVHMYISVGEVDIGNLCFPAGKTA
jgi:hypothetical protein